MAPNTVMNGIGTVGGAPNGQVSNHEESSNTSNPIQGDGCNGNARPETSTKGPEDNRPRPNLDEVREGDAKANSSDLGSKSIDEANKREPQQEPAHAERLGDGRDKQSNEGPAAESDGRPPGHDEPRRPATDLKAVKGKFVDQKDKLKTKAHPPGGFDDTPLPDAPQGYTLKFIFHRATNLPAADLSTASSDPFLFATLRAAVPKRHKEDPDLSHRTRTVRRRTEPVWEDEWVVANVPASGFTLKCRLYDEDSPDHNDRLGNVTVKVDRVDESWEGYAPPGQEFVVKKRMGSKRAYFFKGVASAISRNIKMSPTLFISIQVLGKSDPPHAQMCTVGPTVWIKHFSPMIGRLTGTMVHKDETDDVHAPPTQHKTADGAGSSIRSQGDGKGKDRQAKKSKKYDFQACELQLSGPVPPRLYHRYVAFRPTIGLMFSSHGIRGKILNKALHKQHDRVYNFDRKTEWGRFEPCSEEATMQFLRMAHFDEGGRIFTYVLTLDAVLRFTETGKEFGIDLLSKHTMHSDVATYIACSGEFFIRRLEHPDASSDPRPDEGTHPDTDLPGGPPKDPPPNNPSYYQLVIDNDSGTYRPDKSVLPELQKFLERNLPGLGVVVMHCQDEELSRLKEAQNKVKKKEGKAVNMVLNRSPSSSSMSSGLSALDAMDQSADGPAMKSAREKAWDLVEEPRRVKEVLRNRTTNRDGESSAA